MRHSRNALFTYKFYLIPSLAHDPILLSFDHMNSALHKKLRLRENSSIGLVNKPVRFDDSMLPLPNNTVITKSFSTKNDLIFWFVKTRAELNTSLNRVLAALSETNMIWIGYPKGSSGLQTDLTRDHGWDELMQNTDISFVSYIAFDSTWSLFSIRKKNKVDHKREQNQTPRAIFEYADPLTKTIKLPADLEATFLKNKKAKKRFEQLAFSHRKEYVEWIISAKREETRQSRLQRTIEKLNLGQKNPTAH